MAGAAPIQLRDGRRALDAVINLVPFIDLLSCCLAFLLITAVWTQLGRVDVQQRASGGEIEEPVPRLALTLSIDTDGYTLAASTGEVQSIAADYAQLAAALRTWRTRYPDQEHLSLRPADAIAYDRILRTMDVALSARYATLGFAG